VPGHRRHVAAQLPQLGLDRLRCQAGPAVLVWNGSKNFTVVANAFVNNQREIAFGLQGPGSITDDNTGGIIANNMIYRGGGQNGDVAIGA
jgi:hypothetical protein